MAPLFVSFISALALASRIPSRYSMLTIVPAVWGFYHRHAVWEALSPARNWAGGISL